MFDTIIVGTGPAGFTAAIYAARRTMKTLVIGKEIGGQLAWATEIENYPGFKSISAFDLVNKFHEQVIALGVEVKNETVLNIEKKDDFFIIRTSLGEFSTKTIILTLGLSPRTLGVPGEVELTGRGVCYCANCDAPFFKNKSVIVVGGGNCALDAADVLSKIASQVYVVNRDEKIQGFEKLFHELKERKNIEFISNSSVTAIVGDIKVTGAKITNDRTNEEKEIKVDGVFVEIGRIAKTDLVKNLVNVDNHNQVVVDAEAKTSTPGVFAAGDVTNSPFKQITIACGQATIAALSAYKYLQLKK